MEVSGKAGVDGRKELGVVAVPVSSVLVDWGDSCVASVPDVSVAEGEARVVGVVLLLLLSSPQKPMSQGSVEQQPE